MSDNEKLGKRVRKPKQFVSKEEEEEDKKFWQQIGIPESKDHQDDSDEEEDYEPEPSKQIKTSDQSSSNNQQDYIDSQPIEENSEDYEDVSESVIPDEDQRIQLIRANLKQYGTLRSVHNYLLINTLPRLNNSSYIEYVNKQTYKTYIGVPELGPSDDEQIKSKTEFHSILFLMEDQRYQLDLEIKQLKRCLKLQPEKMIGYIAIKNMGIKDDVPIYEQIENRIQILQDLKKNHIQSIERKTEDICFKFSIDQQYFMHRTSILSELSSRKFQNLTNNRIQQVWNDQIPLPERAQMCLQKWSSLKEQNEDVSELLAEFGNKNLPIQALPTYILQFDHYYALYETTSLLRLSFTNEKYQQDVKFLLDFFDDFINALFGIQLNELKNYEFHNQELLQELKNFGKIEKENTFEEVEKIFEQVDDEIHPVFPQIETAELSLYGRPVLTYLILNLFCIYERMKLLFEICGDKSCQIGEKQYQLSDLVIELIKRVILTNLNDALYEDLLLQIFNREEAINFYSLITLVSHFIRLLINYNFDSISVKFQLYWLKKKMGFQTFSNYIEEMKLEELSKMKIEDLLQNTAMEARKKNNNLNMCRVQSQNGIIVIHQFDVVNLFEENKLSEKQSENKID